MINARLEQIIAAIKNSNEEKMKGLFSINALQEAEYIDKEIEQLLALFPDDIDSWEHVVNEVSESTDQGKKEKTKNQECTGLEL